jgi:hypothetical protein
MRQLRTLFPFIDERKKKLVLGCALTGAKFTPKNHRITGDDTLDAICRGDRIPTTFDQVEREAVALYRGGCRYLHIHARNPKTREQSCDNSIYAAYNQRLVRKLPDLILSYGGSRNGLEIHDAIKRDGEWARISQAALPIEDGGAHFVTIQAAIELQIVTDLERRGYVRIDEQTGRFDWLKSVHDYVPSGEISEASISVYSTAGGKHYGSSSARTQYISLQDAITSRHCLGLPQEVEWVQFARSHVMTALACTAMNPGLQDSGRLNITLLFGFSPKLPFPLTYGEFQHVVATARSIETARTTDKPFRLSISVGAAVLPQHAARYVAPLDVGPRPGRLVSPLERLIAYASQPDSGVDLVRFGMEDTPYLVDARGTLHAADNLMLMKVAVDEIEANGAEVVTGTDAIRDFRSCPSVPHYKTAVKIREMA